MPKGKIVIEFEWETFNGAWKYVDAIERAATAAGDGETIQITAVEKVVFD